MWIKLDIGVGVILICSIGWVVTHLLEVVSDNDDRIGAAMLRSGEVFTYLSFMVGVAQDRDITAEIKGITIKIKRIIDVDLREVFSKQPHHFPLDIVRVALTCFVYRSHSVPLTRMELMIFCHQGLLISLNTGPFVDPI